MVRLRESGIRHTRQAALAEKNSLNREQITEKNVQVTDSVDRCQIQRYAETTVLVLEDILDSRLSRVINLIVVDDVVDHLAGQPAHGFWIGQVEHLVIFRGDDVPVLCPELFHGHVVFLEMRDRDTLHLLETDGALD